MFKQSFKLCQEFRSDHAVLYALVAGEGEIEDGGVGFEDALVQVVTKLRQDRDKSYDDLTGS